MLSHNNNSNQANIINKVNNGFTEAAIAGLAAKEDFTSVVLKRSESSNSYAGEYLPFSELMLIQIKGILNDFDLFLDLNKWISWYYFVFRTSLLPTKTGRALHQLTEQQRLFYIDRTTATLSLHRRTGQHNRKIKSQRNARIHSPAQRHGHTQDSDSIGSD